MNTLTSTASSAAAAWEQFKNKINKMYCLTRSQRDNLINAGWVEMQGRGFKNATSKLGYLVSSSFAEVFREEQGVFVIRAGADARKYSRVFELVSIDAQQEDGRPIFEPVYEAELISKFEELEAELTESENEVIELVRYLGTAEIAVMRGCSQRAVQLWLQSFVESVKARLACAGGVQGDLFWGTL